MESIQTLPIIKGLDWIGVPHDDPHVIQSFMEAKYGSTCNSYLVQGAKSTALFDVVAFRYLDGFVDILKTHLGDLRKIDYVILNRTDPAHSSAVEKLLDMVPKIKVVGTKDALSLLRRTMTTQFESITVTTGSILDLGDKTIKFYYTPFRHMQDTMFSYLVEDKVLFTCDAFSAHYCFAPMLFSKMDASVKKTYTDALRDYYDNIFGVSRAYVHRVMSYLSPLSVEFICPSHGPIIDKKPDDIADLYRSWVAEPSKNGNKKAVAIPYMADNEHTETLLRQIVQGLKDAGEEILVRTYPIDTLDYPKQKEDLLQALEDSEAALFGSPTINGDAAPPLLDLVTSMNPLRHGGKYLSAFGVYAWDNQAVDNISSRLDQLNGLVMDGLAVPFHALSKESAGAYNFGKSFGESIVKGSIPPRRILGDDPEYGNDLPITDTKAYLWTCGVCTFHYRDQALPPAQCPACGARNDMFFKEKSPTSDFTSEAPIKLVIIGNGAASVTAASEARRRNKNAEITIISEEAEDAYFRAELAKKLADGLDLKNFYVRSPEWYHDRNITVMRSARASKIDNKTKEVTLAGGTVLKYDKLIVATGSSPYMPPIRDAMSKRGVFTLHDKGDMGDIRSHAKQCSKAIVVGSGNLGLMTALQLKKLGLEVEIIEKAPRIFMKYMDNKGSHLMAHALHRMGVRLRTNCDIKAVIGEGLDVTGVELEFGQRVRADMIIFCTGIKPNTEIVRGTPLKVNRGLDVNENMRTLDSAIYACGDVAEYKGNVAGFWATAVSQGRIAGANAVGDGLIYRETPQPVIFNMPVVNKEYPDLDINMSLFSVGYIENIDNSIEHEYSALEHFDPEAFIYHKFYFEGGRLIAAILIGNVNKAGLVYRSVINEAAQEHFLHDFYR